jgi:hypothetical protein
MLTQFWRPIFINNTGQTLTFDSGARIDSRFTPWKIVSSVNTPGTTLIEDFGFGAGDTITTGTIIAGTARDNTSDAFWGINGFFEVITDHASSVDNCQLYIEFSDEDDHWPSDSSDFAIGDAQLLATLLYDGAEDHSTNFKV